MSQTHSFRLPTQQTHTQLRSDPITFLRSAISSLHVVQIMNSNILSANPLDREREHFSFPSPMLQLNKHFFLRSPPFYFSSKLIISLFHRFPPQTNIIFYNKQHTHHLQHWVEWVCNKQCEASSWSIWIKLRNCTCFALSQWLLCEINSTFYQCNTECVCWQHEMCMSFIKRYDAWLLPQDEV